MTKEEIQEAIIIVERLLYGPAAYEEIEDETGKLLHHAQRVSEVGLQIELRAIQAQNILNQGRRKEALDLGEELLAEAMNHQEPRLQAIVHGLLGFVYNANHDFKQALFHLEKAIALYDSLGDNRKYAFHLVNAGNAYFMLGDTVNTLIYWGKALSFTEQLGWKKDVAAIAVNMGALLNSIGDHNKSLDYDEKALAMHNELGQEMETALVYSNMGVVYQALGYADKGIECLKKAIALCEKWGLKKQLAESLHNIGFTYGSNHQYDEAVVCLERAINLYRELDDPLGVASSLGNLGSVLSYPDFKGFDPIKAEEYLKETIHIHTEYGSEKRYFELERDLARLYKHQRKWEDSLLHFEKFYELEQQVKSDEIKNQTQLFDYNRKLADAERDRQVKLARFQEQEKILHNILPSQIAERILEGEKQIADYCENVSVFFSDIVGFTKISAQVSPAELVEMLNQLFTEFDRVARKYGLEKIKTIGDAYMAVAGVPEPMENHAENAARFALEVMEVMKAYRERTGNPLEIRVGLHTGHAVAGVIGENKFAYDLWGDAVNTASRMESHGEPGKINVSDDFRKALADSAFSFEERGELEVKGKGKMKTYFLNDAL